MMSISVVFILVILIGFELFCYVLLLVLSNKEKRRLSMRDITLIVPFKNESKNLPNFLSTLLHQNQLPVSVLFINDHSTDSSDALFQKELHKNIKYFTLPKGIQGKKEALRYGIKRAETSHILTMDADVVLTDNYFKALEKLEVSDLTVLPVIMKRKSNKFSALLASFDYNLLQSLNYLLSSCFVLTSSGANLLFSKASFEQVDNYSKHAEILSGDDHYLLRAFQKRKKSILVSNNFSCAVSTHAVTSFKQFYNQRSRWLGKLFVFSTWWDWLAGAPMFFFFLFSCVVPLYFFLQMNWIYLFITLLGVFSIYLIPYWVYFKKVTIGCFLVILIGSFLYPFFFFIILFKAIFRKSDTW